MSMGERSAAPMLLFDVCFSCGPTNNLSDRLYAGREGVSTPVASPVASPDECASMIADECASMVAGPDVEGWGWRGGEVVGWWGGGEGRKGRKDKGKKKKERVSRYMKKMNLRTKNNVTGWLFPW